jgi:hypothetical protein
MAGKIDGFGVFAIGVGAVFVYGGIKGYSPLKALENVIQGKNPNESQNTVSLTADTTNTGNNPASSIGGFATPSGSSNSSGQAALKQAAHAYGWDTGNEWQALNNVEMAEAGYSATARNPSSGALGMAQALGHGNSNTTGSLGNEYGGYGLSDTQAKEANSGNAYWQAVWMCNYIHSTYGDPIKAWEHEQSQHWY